MQIFRHDFDEKKIQRSYLRRIANKLNKKFLKMSHTGPGVLITGPVFVVKIHKKIPKNCLLCTFLANFSVFFFIFCKKYLQFFVKCDKIY